MGWLRTVRSGVSFVTRPVRCLASSCCARHRYTLRVSAPFNSDSDSACPKLLTPSPPPACRDAPHSLYPWDRYYFSVHISVHAIVKNLDTGEVHRVGVPMLFQFEQSTSTYFIHQVQPAPGAVHACSPVLRCLTAPQLTELSPP